MKTKRTSLISENKVVKKASSMVTNGKSTPPAKVTLLPDDGPPVDSHEDALQVSAVTPLPWPQQQRVPRNPGAPFGTVLKFRDTLAYHGLPPPQEQMIMNSSQKAFFING